MRGIGKRVQLGLLLGAVFLPCAVLGVLGWRVANQDRELRASRRAEERKRVLKEAGGRLRAVLDRIRADEIRTGLEPGQRYRHTETVFVGWTDGGQLALPWEVERDRAIRRNRELISERRFDSAIRACEPQGPRSRETAAAEECYRRAEALSRHPLQSAYARWQLAEALESAGEHGRAAPLMRSLLETGPEFTDLDGIPLKLHAGQSLLHAGTRSPLIPAALDSALSARPWTSPMALLIISQAAQALSRGAGGSGEKLAATALEERSAAQVRLVDQAQSLQTEFPRLLTALKTSWVPFGEDLWLIGLAGEAEHDAAVLAVGGRDAFRSAMIPGAERLADSRDPAGEFLGNPFPGLKLVLAQDGPPDVRDGPGIQRYLFPLALSLAMLVTLFAAYLLWRDLEREMRLSELRTQFVSSVSHELKTPLTAIRMFAETLQMGRCPDQRTQAEYLGTIVNECERLSRLVDGVLLFSRAEQGRKTYRFRAVEAAEAVCAAARAMEYPFSQHGFRLHLEIADDLPPLWADRDAIEQAVLNLLSNAMKFSGDSREIELALYVENGEAVIRVTDHGIGIEPEEQERIFEKFYRVSTPQNQLIPGAGLGLAIVTQIAHAHGGKVAVESAPGKGSRFYLRVPVQAGAAPAKEQSV